MGGFGRHLLIKRLLASIATLLRKDNSIEIVSRVVATVISKVRGHFYECAKACLTIVVEMYGAGFIIAKLWVEGLLIRNSHRQVGKRLITDPKNVIFGFGSLRFRLNESVIFHIHFWQSFFIFYQRN
jgi:hypothetical protein